MKPVETAAAAPQEPPQKPPVWWIFMPFELFFSLFPDITPYFAIFYFTVYQYILAFGIATMIYSYRVDQLSYLSLLMVYVGIRQPAWYLFYLYALLWIGIYFLSQMMYESPPWTLDWMAEVNEMQKKGDASPMDAADDSDDAAATKHTTKKKSKNLDKIFEDVDTDDDEDDDDNTK
jgi:hypothetical protein